VWRYGVADAKRRVGAAMAGLAVSRLGFRESARVAVALTEQTTGQTYAFQAQSDGRLQAMLPEGDYVLYATHAGYSTVGITLAVRADMPPYRFYLDPLSPPREADWRYLWSLRRPNQMIVVGFVTDEGTGQPLVGVQVRVRNHAGATTTDANGMFLLQFPIQDLQGKAQPYATLVLERAGYRTLQLEQVALWSEGDWIYRLTMTAGSGVETRDMRSPRHRDDAPQQPCDECDTPKHETPAETPVGAMGGDFSPAAPAPIVLPKYIKVGRNCTSRTNCPGGVEVYTIDTYCKGVITSEWYACWGNVRFGSENPPAGMESLRAGAVAVRSYGVSFVFTPINSSYDICDSTSCQVFTGNQSSNGNAAVDATTRYVLLTSAGNIARSEYSAENNNAGCGDGFSGTGSSWPCIADPVCAGFSTFGHGRGLCQWGSARWATGRRLSSSQACSSSAPLHGLRHEKLAADSEPLLRARRLSTRAGRRRDDSEPASRAEPHTHGRAGDAGLHCQRDARLSGDAGRVDSAGRRRVDFRPVARPQGQPRGGRQQSLALFPRAQRRGGGNLRCADRAVVRPQQQQHD
jgi:hypothetical protein